MGIFVIANLAKTIDKDDLLLKWARECIAVLAELKFCSDDRQERICWNIKEILSSTKEDFLPTREIERLLKSNKKWGWSSDKGNGLKHGEVNRALKKHYLTSDRERSIDKYGFYVADLKEALHIH